MVFDRYVSWETNMDIVGWVAVCSKSVPVLRFLAMQCIKKASTLRISGKLGRYSPRVFYRYGEQGHAVADFLKERERIKRIYRLLH